MKSTQVIDFSPFQLDVLNEQLWKDGQLVTLRPKTLAVLRYLLEHPGRLITKEELLKTVWAETRVSEALPKDYVQELRKALNDDPKSPRFIETVHGRGYRFIASLAPLHTTPPVASRQSSVVSPQRPEAQRAQLGTGNWELGTNLVGRESELAQLHEWLAKALRGERQVVFVTGEPGIGKTTLVEALFAQAASQNDVWIARGQCLEHYGVGEPYMPMFDALGHLCRGQQSEIMLAILMQHAPTWLAQMPGLVGPEDLELLQRRVHGATRERMLREMGEAIEVLTADRPLILVLEDLHWSDHSTLDLITILAQRKSSAKLLFIGTYRPADARSKNHPLTDVKQELQIHRQCEELPLNFLQETAVVAYLTARFPHGRVPTSLGRTIHKRTEGSPLFMVNMVDYLASQGMIAKQQDEWAIRASIQEIESVVPESLQQIIEKQFEDCTPQDRQLLEAASVAGAEFWAAAVAGGLQEEEEQVEERCAALARRESFVRLREYQQWPDGSVTGRYSFIHAQYQEVLYNRITPSRRMRLHKYIGEREEAGYGDRRGDVASELASHFERGRDHERTVQYLQLAGENALRRCAYQEAIAHCTKALQILKLLPASPGRVQQELLLQITLGAPLIATRGHASPEVEQVYACARELCRQVGETPQLFPVLWGLWVVYFVRGDFQIAQDLSLQLLQLARATNDTALLLEAHVASGLTWVCLGKFSTALEHLEEGITLYDPERHGDHAFVYGQDPGVVCLSWTAWALWSLGYPDRALKRSREAITLARRLSSPFSLAYALGAAAGSHQHRREGQQARARAEETITLSGEQGFNLWSAAGHVVKGWALVDRGQPEKGITQLHEGLIAWQTTGAGFLRSYGFALLSEAYQKTGQIDEGLSALEGAFAIVKHSGERLWEAELYRLKGELTLQQSSVQGLASSVQTSQKSKVKSQKSKIPNTQRPTSSSRQSH